MTRFAVWRSLANSVVPLDEVRAAESETTAGRRDKRHGTPARYVIVVVGIFSHSGESHSAAHRPNAKHSAKVDGTIARTLGFSS